jgi:hypothetical protein
MVREMSVEIAEKATVPIDEKAKPGEKNEQAKLQLQLLKVAGGLVDFCVRANALLVGREGQRRAYGFDYTLQQDDNADEAAINERRREILRSLEENCDEPVIGPASAIAEVEVSVSDIGISFQPRLRAFPRRGPAVRPNNVPCNVPRRPLGSRRPARPRLRSLERIELSLRLLGQAEADQLVGCSEPVPKLILGRAPRQVHP